MLPILRAACAIGLLMALLGTLLTVAAAATVDSPAASCRDLLVNGDFEAGPAGWTQGSAGGYDLINRFNPRSGQWGAYLAGANDADDRLNQPLALPSDAISITLGLWWSMVSEEPSAPADTLSATLLRPDGTLLAELWRVDNTAPQGLWDETVIDLSSYAGQSVILRFQALSNSFDLTDFYLDDLSLTTCTPAATANRVQLPLIVRQG